MADLKHLSEQDSAAVTRFSGYLREALGRNLEEIRLFGSKARGDDFFDSDIDLLVIVKQRNAKVDDQVLNIAFEVSLDLDVLISPVVFSHDEYYAPLVSYTLFFENTQREGIPV